jgi:hypothetical protein
LLYGNEIPLVVLATHCNLVIFSLILAALAQLASLIDPVIFGLIIDKFAAPKQVWLKGSWWAVSLLAADRARNSFIVQTF